MPSQNESILKNSKATIVGSITEREKINIGEIIEKEILLRSRHEQTSLPFLVLITQLCEKVGVPFRAKIDVMIMLVSSSDIRRIETGFLRDNAAWKKPLLPDSTQLVDPATLTLGTNTPAPSV
uniref:Putative plant transposon protein domain-containing protein n=1 Tax=Solanum tuberosum TaxID=4113 RepID=M1DZ79_SOLTU